MRMASFVGPNHAKWNTQVGVYVRARIPIHYKDWRKIDGSFKDNVWNKLMEEFEPNVPQTAHAEKLKMTFPKSSDHQSMPLERDFCDKEDPSRKHGRVDSWKKGHGVADGTILAKLKPIILWADKGSRTRGISSNKSKKQLQRHVLPRHYCNKQALHPIRVEGEMNEMKSSLSNVIGVLKMTLHAASAHLVADKCSVSNHAVNLKSSELLDHPSSEICNGVRQNALVELFQILTTVCESHKLALAQTWVPCKHRRVVADGGGGVKKSCRSFDGSCMGQVCM
ncbi:hypothetical protein IFM89_002666 [Coptis chinensis]|uniref:NLP1-9 GAF domain-containing protein n=1 Tax=Coptis chinensis TaxID=261450 RepID=A0A835ILK3_9MAGN|nr:hypothetical protein IFM89_002666 [Coptis chinensis]